MVDYAVYAYEQNDRALRRQLFTLQAVLALAGLQVTCVVVGDYLDGGGVGRRRDSDYVRRRQSHGNIGLLAGSRA